MEKTIKEAEVYSKVERLFIKERNKQVVEGLNKWMASSGKQVDLSEERQNLTEESAL